MHFDEINVITIPHMIANIVRKKNIISIANSTLINAGTSENPVMLFTGDDIPDVPYLLSIWLRYGMPAINEIRVEVTAEKNKLFLK